MYHRIHALTCAVVLGLVLALPARADLTDDARNFVARNGDTMLTILDKPAGEKRREVFHAWLRETFDLETLASLALGPYRQGATPEQLAAYSEAFADYIVVTYEARFDSFTSYGFQVGQARPMNNNDIAVRTAVSDPSGKTVAVDFRVREGDRGLQVIDVAVEGLSMLKTQRDEFSSVIQRNGLDGLIANLKQYTEQVTSQ
jgi:phospholipid transport system substrate-binding protein